MARKILDLKFWKILSLANTPRLTRLGIKKEKNFLII
jgi:hypothetical protein